MNIFKKLFGNPKPTLLVESGSLKTESPRETTTSTNQTTASAIPKAPSIDQLVEKLVSNYESDFLDGLREAVGRADSGDYTAVEAMREAMRIRSGKNIVSFYSPGIVMTMGFDRYLDAESKILELAKSQALLKDPEQSGDLIMALNTVSDANTMRDVLHKIYALGNKSEGFAFQLIFNEMRCSARLRA